MQCHTDDVIGQIYDVTGSVAWHAHMIGISTMDT